MKELEICCCGARRWTLVIAWLQIIWGIWALVFFVKIGVDILGVIKPEKDLQNERELSSNILSVLMGIFVVLAVLAVLSIIMAVILILGCNNKNPKQINIWIIYDKILLVIVVVALITRLFVIPVEQITGKILSLCIEVAMQVFCIWFVGIHKREIEASSGALVAYKAYIFII